MVYCTINRQLSFRHARITISVLEFRTRKTLGLQIMDFDFDDEIGLWGGRVLDVHKSALMPQSGHKSWPPENNNYYLFKLLMLLHIYKVIFTHIIFTYLFIYLFSIYLYYYYYYYHYVILFITIMNTVL